MDSSDEANEVSFRSRGTPDLDKILDDSSEDTTVKIPMTSADLRRTQTVTTPDSKLMKSEENINSILAFLVDEIKNIKLQMEPKSGNPSEISDEDLEEDSVSVNSRLGEFVPVDQGRWKSSKAADQAQINLTQTLKDLDISTNERVTQGIPEPSAQLTILS